jgi:hypothetical protein
MIVVLAADVFAAPTVDRLDLAAPVAICRGDPHAIELDPPFDPQAPPAGLDSFGDAGREIELVLEYGPEAASQRPRGCPRVRVVAGGPSNWRAPVPRLSVLDALRLLAQPLQILVENRRNDGAFLRKMLPPERRKEFERYERDAFVRIDSEGGLGEMSKRVERASASPEEAARLWLLFDRDCRGDDPLDPLAPSEPAQSLADLCAAVQTPWPLRHHMLQRRAIENHLPLDALLGWAGVDRERRDLADAFRELSSVQEPGLTAKDQTARARARRLCFPMKKGLLGDVASKEERKRLEASGDPLQDGHLAVLFRPLSPAHRERLRHGFGSQIAQLYHDAEGVARVLAPEDDTNERLVIASSIAERL